MAEEPKEQDDFLPNRRREIDKVSRESGFGRTYGANADVFRGLDHRHAGAAFQKNSDHRGLTFFTRPLLNLSYNNILADRVLLPLLDEDPNRQWRAIRNMLDPRQGLGSNLFDEDQAFITILTNTLTNISGFPDATLDSYEAPAGVRKETYGYVDSVSEINESFDITATFANIEGDPITALFQYWTRYMGNVYAGDMVPYPEFVIANEVDYQCRIWRLILDKSKRYVKKIGCANTAYPFSDAMGNAFNFSVETPYSDATDQISVPFKCIGAEYQDPILYTEFNLTVQYFNSKMRDGPRESIYQKLTPAELDAFNFNGYPRINPKTLELEWWISQEEYKELTR